MTGALEKNRQALFAMFKSDQLVQRLEQTRIAIVLPASRTAAARLLSEFLVDSLARLWPNIDIQGAEAQTLVDIAVAAGASGGVVTTGYVERWQPPYDCVIAIGCDAPVGAAPAICVGADGWLAEIGDDAVCSDDANPIGPAFAAALAGAQTFLHVFRDELRDTGASEIADGKFDAREVCGCADLEVSDLHFRDVHFIGVGAVTHGLLALLNRWPRNITGEISLVDADAYGTSNGQRYSFLRASDVGNSKVDTVAEAMRKRHVELTLHPFRTDLNSYCAAQGYPEEDTRYVVGLDSAESRRQAALKYPGHCVNMWTEGVRIGAGRFFPAAGGACLGCDYLEDVSKPFDQVTEVHRTTQLRPDVVRDLLDSARGLAVDEAAIVANATGLPLASIVGEPLRSVLPMVCSTVPLQLQPGAELTDVPFAFASLMAGIAGFLMLLRDMATPSTASEGWTQHLFKPPKPSMHRHLAAQARCPCCQPVRELSSS
ncbi:ThiF family adenylyltransferase [Paraburkholderia terrae]|uniref:ThiF family adenylyltransferase n=1 Tax=Paraburkholderia terrae TaxID=311230 RepID=UPI00296ABE3A|nr:ThiF family adenylyltransferase [Paraburkholderia terrae]MDW3660432.1 ThiF family adenylyltransferase [Paraburkholderia terrae]